MKDIKSIALWHEETFPAATVQEQKLKFAEEFGEWKNSQDILELADMYIVACGLTRYPTMDAAIAFHAINEECLLNHIMSKDLMDAVADKMDTNQRRSWKRVANVGYRHI